MRLFVAACLLLAGCALLESRKTGETRLGPAEIRSARTAAEAIAVGKSTKADVRAALGQAVVVDFETGYEVWVYREQLKEKAKPPATELVLLFDPPGTLIKSRIR
ncbi:MAG TPA: hypothetical protein VGF58_08000 [Burkholderiales bacterium]